MKLALCLALFSASSAYATDFALPPTPDTLSLQAVSFDLLREMHEANDADVSEEQNGKVTAYTLSGLQSSLSCRSDGQFSCTLKNTETVAVKSSDEKSTQALLFGGMDARFQAQQNMRDHHQHLPPTLPVDRFDSFAESGRFLTDGKYSLACYKAANPVSYYCEAVQVPAQQTPPSHSTPNPPGQLF